MQVVEGTAALAAAATLAGDGGVVTVGVFVVNSTVDAQGRRVPVSLDDVSWVGGLYRKQGNVFKYVVVAPLSVEGRAGVFGPIPLADLQAALDADGDDGTWRGWQVAEVDSVWKVGGQRAS